MILLLTITACNGSVQPEATPEPTPTQEPTPTPEPTPEPAPDSAKIFTSADDIREITAAELQEEHENNSIRFSSEYIDSFVIIESTVKEIETEEWLSLDDESYTPAVVVYLDGGWVVSVSSTDDILTKLNRGDSVRAIGTITGCEFLGNICVLSTSTHGHRTLIELADTEYPDITAEDPGLIYMIDDLYSNGNYTDAAAFANYYIATYPNDEEQVQSLNANMTVAESTLCYPGTMLKKYSWCFFPDVTVEEIEDVELYGVAYDNYDSNASGNIQTYCSYVKSQGYVQQSEYVTIEVNGRTDTYVYFKHPSGNIIAFAQGDGFVRIVVFPWETLAQ